MEDFIKAMNIFLQYGNPEWPFHCEHDVLLVAYHVEDLSSEDVNTLDDLGFHWDDDRNGFISFKYGSC